MSEIHYVGSGLIAVVRQAIGIMHRLGLRTSLIEGNRLSASVQQACVVFIVGGKARAGNYLIVFPREVEKRQKFAEERGITIPAYALHAEKLVALRHFHDPQEVTHRGQDCEKFERRLAKLHESTLREQPLPPKPKDPALKKGWRYGRKARIDRERECTSL